MIRRIVGGTLFLTVLLPVTGCRHRGTTTFVVEDQNGNLLPAVDAEHQHRLTWKSPDPDSAQFWIKFSPADYCEQAINGVIASVSGVVTCDVNAQRKNSNASYQLNRHNPSQGLPPGDQPIWYEIVGNGGSCMRRACVPPSNPPPTTP